MTEPLRGGAGRDTLTLTAIASQDEQDRALLTKAQEIVELFQRAIKLGYSITLPPEQMQLLVAICERAYLTKGKP